MKTKETVVAGVMSGTSADGINVALVRVRGASHSFELVGHAEFSYPAKVRTAILAAMNSDQALVADLARLNFLLGELYADAVMVTQRRFRQNADLIGCHGQTLYHQGEPQYFLGHSIATTWQTGEAAIIASRIGVPVVSDFRPADMAAGGKGAPLVPFLDYLLFRDSRIGRIVQNIGGIANLTAIPASAAVDEVIAFDTGPGNMVIDTLTEQLFGKRFDRGGKIASAGLVLEPVVQRVLRQSFFSAKPPKTAGREEFGREFVISFLQSCGRSRKEDVIAAATALTARSIADAVKRFVILRPGAPRKASWEMIVSGGGTRNATLMRMLTESLAPMTVPLRTSDDLGLPSEAKEAAAFALLAYETWHRRPSNVPSATGAKRAAILGKISYP
ncbi:MAG: anhydro-N-acetylmuramic acid kinase [Candidatus Sulfotelmatobacter sp.]